MGRVAEAQTHLAALGWDNVKVDDVLGPITKAAVANFQNGFAFWGLLVDGLPGPKTNAAMQHSRAVGGFAGQFFRFTEFRCKGPRSDRGCERIWVDHDLIQRLDRYRAAVNRPVRINSGCRCVIHNRRVGGASASQHLYGDAADISGAIGRTAMARLGLFSGIGYNGSTGLVVHVDVRHLGKNTTGGTPARPTIWRYSR